MKVHLFTTKGFAGKYTFPCDAGPATATKKKNEEKKKQSQPAAETMSIQSERPFTRVPVLTMFVMTCTSGGRAGRGPDCNVQFAFIAPPFRESQLLL